MNRFNPASNYEELLKQANALYTLCKSQEKTISFLNKRNYELSEKRLSSLEKDLESEREMNHVLTEELERLKKD